MGGRYSRPDRSQKRSCLPFGHLPRSYLDRARGEEIHVYFGNGPAMKADLHPRGPVVVFLIESHPENCTSPLVGAVDPSADADLGSNHGTAFPVPHEELELPRHPSVLPLEVFP